MEWQEGPYNDEQDDGDDGVESGLAAATAPYHGGRINSLCPPYSFHSQCAVVLMVFFVLGVNSATKLPPFPLPHVEAMALRVWAVLFLVWSPLLAWLLLKDPRARPAPQGSFLRGSSGNSAGGSTDKIVQCRYGCAFTACVKTKHCRKCDKCVDGFDHHCLWLNTCVGSRNYRPWIMFVAVLFLWSLLGSCISISALVRSWEIQSRRLAVGHRPTVFAAGFCAAGTATWLLVLLALHAYFAYHGITTLEWAKGVLPPRRSKLQSCILVPLNCMGRGVLGQIAAPPPVPAASGGVPSDAEKAGASPINLLRRRAFEAPAAIGGDTRADSSCRRRKRNFKFRRTLSLSSVATIDDESSQEDPPQPVEPGSVTPSLTPGALLRGAPRGVPDGFMLPVSGV